MPLKVVTALKARQIFGTIMNAVSFRNDQYIVERKGVPMVAIIPIKKFKQMNNAKQRFFKNMSKISESFAGEDPQRLDDALKEATDTAKKSELARQQHIVKIVIDANLFASALIKPNSNPGKILSLVERNEVELVLSPAIIREVKRILLYPKIQKYHRKTSQEIDVYFDDLLMFAWIVEGEKVVDIIKDDPADNKYLACADEGEADFIVSGDHHLLDLETFPEIDIINAREFLSIWKKQTKS